MTRQQETELVLEAARAIEAVDSAAFLVTPRILRRVIKEDRALPGLGFHIPHRKSYVISRERLLRVIGKDELGHVEHRTLPHQLLLISLPDEAEMQTIQLQELLAHAWRLLFHARIHVVMESKLESGKLSAAGVRARIHRIGQAEFDEIQAVVRQENFLLPPINPPAVFVEFAAVYLELRFFSPHWLSAYFPSLDDFERIDEILAEDIDARTLFERTRPANVPDPELLHHHMGEADEAELIPSKSVVPISEKRSRILLKRAETASERGNLVRGALLRQRVAQQGPSEFQMLAESEIKRDLELLTSRLQTALGFDEEEARGWRLVLARLLEHATSGFWNADQRLLYDLQNVCIDNERVVSIVDLLEWVRTFGRRSLRRPLPSQREVLMSKHLRHAMARLPAVRLAGKDRFLLGELLQDATRLAEIRLRTQLRPRIANALAEVGLSPCNLPEKVALRKLTEELLDGVVAQGFLTMGNLRDAISRNRIKLNDLSGIVEFVTGDRLLRADWKLSIHLDGVYRRGEFYLRWMQGLSSLAFGTSWGRILTLYLIIPYGGAYVALEFLDHLSVMIVGQFMDHAPHMMASHEIALVASLLLGSFINGLLHVERFRQAVLNIWHAAVQVLRNILIDLPTLIVRWSFIREILLSPPVMLFRRYLLMPLIFTALFTRLLPGIQAYQQPRTSWEIALFIALNLLLNSRLGRNLEDAIAERIERAWHQIRVRVFVALYEVIAETFKRILETSERILYAVDEWLRFKSGESTLMFVLKAALGVVWAIVTFVVRIYLNLLIEPQINPIKHFPVVTVSHKIILPFTLQLTAIMSAPLQLVMGKVAANTIAVSTVFLLPGVFGFLVWELKENWRLYSANRSKQLKPVLVGAHGETLIRLMKPGFHSGTLPKLYSKLRRIERKVSPQRRKMALARYHNKLHHMEEAIRHFVERELLAVLDENQQWGEPQVSVGNVEIASNSLRVELCCPDISPANLWISFQEQSGWLVAAITNSGWLLHLQPHQRTVLRAALAGFYKMGGVDLVREQIESCFGHDNPPYDIAEGGLIVWPDGRYDVQLHYDLRQRTLIRPRPFKTAKQFQFPELHSDQLMFAGTVIYWADWVAVWEADASEAPLPEIVPPTVHLLPDREIVPLAEIG